jgi:hypothetical protein
MRKRKNLMVESGATHAPHSAACYNCKRRFEIAETGVDNGGVDAPDDEMASVHCVNDTSHYNRATDALRLCASALPREGGRSHGSQVERISSR